MNNKRLIVCLLLMSSGILNVGRSQTLWTLEGCKQMALEANKGLKVAEEKQVEAAASEKAALWQMLPRVSANGGYLWMEKSVQLMSNEEHERLETLPIGGNLIAERLAALFETDTRNMGGGAVTVSQPLFMGGKLLALHRTAHLLGEMRGLEYDKMKEDLMVSVEEAYWQVVSVTQKAELAQQYADLLEKLTKDVEEMVEAEVATKGDLTKVKVKRNEAQMNLTKARNGLALAKMLLAQRCGQPLNTEFSVDSKIGVLPSDTPLAASDAHRLSPYADEVAMDSVWARRKEMRMLRVGDSVAMQGVVAARSLLLPNVALTGGYLFSNPMVTDGFQNNWDGMFFAGVVVNVPILHPAAIYSLKAAKAKRREVQWQMEEAQEMVELQVKKVSYELELAERKLAEAQSDLESAEENLKLADESFKAGMANSSDLMAAQTAWLKAKGEVLDARIEIEMSRVTLRQALGE